MKELKEITINIDPKEENELKEMFCMKFVLFSKLLDLGGEVIKDSNGDDIIITNVFSHFNKNLLFDKIIEFNKEQSFNYIHEISYEPF